MADYGTLQWAQDELHRLFEGDTSTPDTTDDEYTYRRSLINRAIHHWENVDAIWWRELWTTTTGTTVPTDFRFPGGFIRVTNTSTERYPLLKPEDDQLVNDSSGKYAYFTGNASAGNVLNFNPSTPSGTITWDYYKRATELVGATDKMEMSNPDFALYYALSELYDNQRDLERAQNALVKAEGYLQDMQIRNDDVAPWGQTPFESLDNYDASSGLGL